MARHFGSGAAATNFMQVVQIEMQSPVLPTVSYSNPLGFTSHLNSEHSRSDLVRNANGRVTALCLDISDQAHMLSYQEHGIEEFRKHRTGDAGINHKSKGP